MFSSNIAIPILPTPSPTGNPLFFVETFSQVSPPFTLLYIAELFPLPVKFHAFRSLVQDEANITSKLFGACCTSIIPLILSTNSVLFHDFPPSVVL